MLKAVKVKLLALAVAMPAFCAAIPGLTIVNNIPDKDIYPVCNGHNGIKVPRASTKGPLSYLLLGTVFRSNDFTCIFYSGDFGKGDVLGDAHFVLSQLDQTGMVVSYNVDSNYNAQVTPGIGLPYSNLTVTIARNG